MEESIEKFRTILKSNLLSCVKFGTEGQKENVLFVLDKIDHATLKELKEPVKWHFKKYNSVPLLFTKEELLDGADVFPLEFLDIKYPHKILYGEDLVNEIKFDKKQVRRQLEFELRSKLIHLRENYIWIKDDKELKQLLSHAIPSIMPLCYGLLFLKDIEIPTKLEDLFKEVKETYGIEVSILRRIQELNDKKTSSEELDKYVKKMLEFLTESCEIVDEMKV